MNQKHMLEEKLCVKNLKTKYQDINLLFQYKQLLEIK